ncbi:MAG TPA: hypothetical protein VFN61_11775 [Acidimicrobiales bacterium]|nr:hypothetical protein [Acidimicrobiales bacterium]
MLDHLFLDTVGVLRAALDDTLLERPGQEDRLVFDMLNGDLIWESSVSLPGDGDPPRVTADINLDWSAWSQAAWRGLAAGEEVDGAPEIGIEIVFRAQRLASRPALSKVLEVLPPTSPLFGSEPLARSAPIIEEAYDDEGPAEIAVEVAYEGTYRLPAPAEEDGADSETLFPAWARGRGPDAAGRLGATRQVSAATKATLEALGAWLASTLVHLADLDLDYLPPAEEEEED